LAVPRARLPQALAVQGGRNIRFRAGSPMPGIARVAMRQPRRLGLQASVR
jgi:hypothetical protein